MEFSDIMFVIKWWLVLFGVGIIFLPVTSVIFKNFFDKGYIFARILGMALISYVVFVLGVLKIAPFTELTVILTIAGFLILNFLIFRTYFKTVIPSLKIFLFEEIIFLSGLFFWSYIRAHQPDIHGLEKYMDFGFVNSIIRSEYFPPLDMWLTPLSINYYYFGHLVTAVLTKLSGIPSSITYNLMLSTIFALTFTASFSIGANLLFNLSSKTQNLKLILGGLLTAFLVSLAGNLHTIYAFFKPYVNESPVPFWQLAFSPQTLQNSYWYPNATRFIQNTIHEFPIYSFVVADLHGHFLDIPFVLLTIAVLLSLIFNFQFSIFSQIKNLKNSNSFQISNFKFQIILLSFLLAVMYMTNAWDGIIYFLLAVIVIIYLKFKQNHNKLLNIGLLVVLVSIGSILFSLPFSLSFKPFASGIGVLCAPEFLTNIGKIGPFLFEKDHCLRSPLWQIMILYGFFYFWVLSFLVFLFKRINPKHEARNPKQYQNTNVKKSKHFGNSNFGHLNLFRISNFDIRISLSDLFVLILILLSTLLIVIPEFIYIKDIYPGHYRANTMFKLVYQSFIMLSIASAYIAVRLISNIKYKIFNFYYVYLIFAILFFILVMIYPNFAINSYYNLKIYQGLDGIKYLKPLYPTDYEAILWINKNIKGQPVILEAQGDSYTDYARISSNTGLPTVLGWTVHEWLWRGTYDVPSPRIPEVQSLYETESLEDAKTLIDKYKIELVFIGNLEKEKYPKLNEEKFKSLGKIIYQNGHTIIYKMSN